MQVILVDNDPLELEHLRALIQAARPHWRTIAACAGPTALNLLEIEHNFFDIAFVNINLPAQDDLMTAQKLRQSGRVADIVIVSAHRDFFIAREAIRMGAADFLTKPITPEELNAVLEKFGEKGALQPVYSPLINRALKILEHHYSDRLSLAELAAALYVNPSYLSRRFKAEVGQSYSQYLIKIRLKNVKKLLVSCPDLSIAQIAAQTGFTSQQHLSALFRRSTGLSPREYRKKSRDAKENSRSRRPD